MKCHIFAPLPKKERHTKKKHAVSSFCAFAVDLLPPCQEPPKQRHPARVPGRGCRRASDPPATGGDRIGETGRGGPPARERGVGPEARGRRRNGNKERASDMRTGEWERAGGTVVFKLGEGVGPTLRWVSV